MSIAARWEQHVSKPSFCLRRNSTGAARDGGGGGTRLQQLWRSDTRPEALR
jgi:hypothetical protein